VVLVDVGADEAFVAAIERFIAIDATTEDTEDFMVWGA
jgi:hypothetical protein